MLPKMAPNSLFAVLLRSPWWVSFGVVVLIVLVARALLPAPYVPFGAAGALPFLVIGCISAWRQWRAPRPAVVEATLQALAALPWREFSTLLQQAYERQGQQVERSTDDDADLVLRKAGATVLVTARRWKAGNHGVEPLRALAASRTRLDASGCVYVSLADPGAGVARFAREAGITLLHGAALAQLVGRSSFTPR